MMTSKEIRNSFKEFFKERGHQIVPSAPMVIKDDPTLMFTNAGMNQFKDIILGNVPIKYPRVADSQKCLRVSGKHNDLEEVGHDTYHHTMFEMLGNWSFGDYFKKEAIEWCWQYLTEVIGLDKNRLYVTVFEGDPSDGIGRDDEAAGYWEQYLPKDRILNGNRKDNFWEMGDTGPCGPCSEIHIDIRPDAERAKVDGLTLVNQSHPHVIEIWNLVFMQFNRKADKSLEPLPARVIDTGMGFERLCMAVQGKLSNYDTDVFQPLIMAIAQLAATAYGQDEKKDIAMRVIADHVRTIAFSITDGQLPSNAKAGYVIRRILRRAVRYGYTFLNQHQAFMYKLIPALIDTMGDAYPELIKQKDLIGKVIKEEEESFLRTLETGIKLLDKLMAEAKANGNTVIEGSQAFTLYDTYGFPLDLTELILRENGMTVNQEGFSSEMQKQKDRARNAAAVETGDWVVLKDGETEFLGYDFTECQAQILRYRQVTQKGKTYYQIVLNRSPFYAEMGGQVGDTGWLIDDNGKTEVIDTKRENNLPVHIVNRLPQDVTASFVAKINTKNRTASECNHTATHLLHEALREVLGEHVEQKGSYVSPVSLRFDFSHFQKLTDEEIRTIERRVTAKIREDIILDEARNIPLAEAKAMGAMALFGEKYADDVRVVRFGSSAELCGGTHISSTGRIGSFRIINESSIAAGIRRIEAITAEACEELFYAHQDVINELKSLLHNTPNLVQAFHKFVEENADMKKKMEEYVKEKTAQIKDMVVSRKQEINGISLFVLRGNFPADTVKDIAFQIRGEYPKHSAFVGVTHMENKPMLTLMLSDDLVASGLNASQIIREAAKNIQGGGGGQPHFATAGGKNTEGLTKAFDYILENIK
ncbi:alanyl-tRNA synthetase [Dysgonomonas sp. PH5-45]|uniref:alanine--tRNA ligase n=1 Tax=unclassified Dysgonomonas TaxID=2630389 RepID=UPI0024759DC9|nr:MULTISPECIES: alanine--tRNA ligase [unclassified Dysgonomonas]MDH6355965.1 alanyl-tRNA synthetase [Dysgonomonas sp. PH5-45]MDH6388860.1 alanyl-tRNA synthetase [Dysgonomonas sp. PH5-37]